MTTRTRATTGELARKLARRLEVSERDAANVLETVCKTLREFLREGYIVELEDLFELSLSGGPEIREDESGGFAAYAPRARRVAAQPVGSFKTDLARSCQAAIYYLSRGQGTFKELLAEHFGRRGWHIVHTQTGIEALGRLERHPPVACVFESSAEGWREFLRELKCDPQTNWVPAVGIFPEAARDEPVTRLTVEPDEIIYEPFDFADFVRTAGMELAERVSCSDHGITELNVQLPGSRRGRREACQMVEETLFRAELPEEFCKEARLALSEALDNAFLHGHQSVDCCTISLRMILDGRRLVLAVRDSGGGFDHAAALTAARGRRGKVSDDPLARAAAALRTRRGEAKEGGIARMLQLVDRVEFNKTGNEVVLTKLRPVPLDDTATNVNAELFKEA